MILSTILLLSPTLSPLALQQAEPQVIIRRQGVESAPQKVRVRVQEPAPVQGRVVQVHPEHSHGEHPHKVQQLQDLETEVLALELANLESELIQLEQAMVFPSYGTQEPGQGESHARIVIRYGDGREEIMEWSGQEGDLHHELNAMLGHGSGQGGMIFLSEQGPDCGDGGDCEEASSCQEISSCETEASCEAVASCETDSSCELEIDYAMADSCASTECTEENVFTWESPEGMEAQEFTFAQNGQISTGAWTTEAPHAMAFSSSDFNFGCECEGCPLSSKRDQRQVIRLGSGPAPMAQAHAQAPAGRAQVRVAAPQVRMVPPQQTQSDHGFSFHAAPPQRVEQHQMRVPMPPTPPMPAQGMRRGGGVTERVEQLEQRLDRIEAMLAELLERR